MHLLYHRTTLRHVHGVTLPLCTFLFLMICSFFMPARSAELFGQAAGDPPVCTSLNFRTWFFRLLGRRESECPLFSDALGRPKRIYFFARSLTHNGVKPDDSNDGRDGLGFGLTQAAWNPVTQTLAQTGAFVNYGWTQGDQIYIAGGTGVTPGLYPIAARLDDSTLLLGASIGQASALNVTSSNGPRATLAAANALTTTTGSIALLFHRGDVWKETANGLPVSVTILQSFVTLADYGPSQLPKPVFSAFAPSYAPSLWMQSSQYPATYRISETNAVAWLREEMSLTRCLVQMTNAAEVNHVPGSWWQDRQNNWLYLNPGNGAHPLNGTRRYEAVYNNTRSGVLIGDNSLANPDGTRTENIRVDGYGASTQQAGDYGFKGMQYGASAWIASNCEAYYNNKHNFGGVNGHMGGITTLIRCRGGFIMTNDTPFVTYAPAGEQETILYQCTCVAGRLQSGQTLSGAPFQFPVGVGAFTAHSSNNALYKSSLTVMWENSVIPGPFQAASGFGGVQNPGTLSGNNVPVGITDYLSFVVGERFPGRPQTAYDLNPQGFPLNPAGQMGSQVQLATPTSVISQIAGIGTQVTLSGGVDPPENASVVSYDSATGRYTLAHPAVGAGRTTMRFNVGTVNGDGATRRGSDWITLLTTGLQHMSWVNPATVVINSAVDSTLLFDINPNQARSMFSASASGLYINCTLVADFRWSEPSLGWPQQARTLTLAGGGDAQFYHCRLHFMLPHGAQGGFDALALRAQATTGIHAMNSIFSADYPDGTTTFQPGLGNVVGNQVANAYVNCTSSTGMGGYDTDQNAVELTGSLPFDPPLAGSPLYSSAMQLVQGYPLEYDAVWRQRSMSADYIGPYTRRP